MILQKIMCILSVLFNTFFLCASNNSSLLGFEEGQVFSDLKAKIYRADNYSDLLENDNLKDNLSAREIDNAIIKNIYFEVENPYKLKIDLRMQDQLVLTLSFPNPEVAQAFIELLYDNQDMRFSIVILNKHTDYKVAIVDHEIGGGLHEFYSFFRNEYGVYTSKISKIFDKYLKRGWFLNPLSSREEANSIEL